MARVKDTKGKKVAKKDDTSADSDSSSDDDEWQVKKIVDHRMKKGKKEYYVKWKGWDSGDNSWEPTANLNCDDLVKDYEKTLQQKDNKKKFEVSAAADTMKKKKDGNESSDDGADTKKDNKKRPDESSDSEAEQGGKQKDKRKSEAGDAKKRKKNEDDQSDSDDEKYISPPKDKKSEKRKSEIGDSKKRKKSDETSGSEDEQGGGKQKDTEKKSADRKSISDIAKKKVKLEEDADGGGSKEVNSNDDDDKPLQQNDHGGTTPNKKRVAEKILDHRVKKTSDGNKRVYLVKWKGEKDSKNSWEPVTNLGCQQVVEAYEKSRKEDKQKRKSEKMVAALEAKQKQKKETKKVVAIGKQQNGFDKGLTADKIIGICLDQGEVQFLIKWREEMMDYELIPSSIVNKQVPRMVIAFYEARVTWPRSEKPCDNAGEDEGKKARDVHAG